MPPKKSTATTALGGALPGPAGNAVVLPAVVLALGGDLSAISATLAKAKNSRMVRGGVLCPERDCTVVRADVPKMKEHLIAGHAQKKTKKTKKVLTTEEKKAVMGVPDLTVEELKVFLCEEAQRNSQPTLGLDATSRLKHAGYFGTVDFDHGTAYSAPGWEEMQPRHHHLTRTSGVLEEEEERSRTADNWSMTQDSDEQYHYTDIVVMRRR
ncbi:Uu.00g111240.m01.CDS01 [Anthostomella pinea]|uniref:Uu.00g111240.m01.CDS01 n=1 Tax=Anthostomella pinea TaxID=933095 RepID=A0AAI8VFR0_9PEZI|nr:Uu.00g111240.m01.CDS01 [Anthostomella pinea]